MERETRWSVGSASLQKEPHPFHSRSPPSRPLPGCLHPKNTESSPPPKALPARINSSTTWQLVTMYWGSSPAAPQRSRCPASRTSRRCCPVRRKRSVQCRPVRHGQTRRRPERLPPGTPPAVLRPIRGIFFILFPPVDRLNGDHGSGEIVLCRKPLFQNQSFQQTAALVRRHAHGLQQFRRRQHTADPIGAEQQHVSGQQEKGRWL